MLKITNKLVLYIFIAKLAIKIGLTKMYIHFLAHFFADYCVCFEVMYVGNDCDVGIQKKLPECVVPAASFVEILSKKNYRFSSKYEVILS